MRLTLLVVSRTPSLLSRMLTSVSASTELPYQEVEILCSWNGNAEGETRINNESGYEFTIAQRDAYHFASNMNSLARKARGEVLLFINDDVILDRGSIGAALNCIENSETTGMVGSRLRNEAGLLTHAGILFDSRHSPYHQLDRLIASQHQAISHRDISIRHNGSTVPDAKYSFSSSGFSNRLQGLRRRRGTQPGSTRASGTQHCALPKLQWCSCFRSNTSKTEGQDGNSEDMSRMRIRRKRIFGSGH